MPGRRVRSDKAGKAEDFKAYAERFVPWVEEREQRILAFNTYLDEAVEPCTLVQVHPDAESMEQHVEVMAERSGRRSNTSTATASRCTANPASHARHDAEHCRFPVTLRHGPAPSTLRLRDRGICANHRRRAVRILGGAIHGT